MCVSPVIASQENGVVSPTLSPKVNSQAMTTKNAASSIISSASSDSSDVPFQEWLNQTFYEAMEQSKLHQGYLMGFLDGLPAELVGNFYTYMKEHIENERGYAPAPRETEANSPASPAKCSSMSNPSTSPISSSPSSMSASDHPAPDAPIVAPIVAPTPTPTPIELPTIPRQVDMGRIIFMHDLPASPEASKKSLSLKKLLTSKLASFSCIQKPSVKEEAALEVDTKDLSDNEDVDGDDEFIRKDTLDAPMEIPQDSAQQAEQATLRGKKKKASTAFRGIFKKVSSAFKPKKKTQTLDLLVL